LGFRGLSIVKPLFSPRKFSRARDLMMRGSLRSMTEMIFGSPDSKKNQISNWASKMILLGAGDILMRVLMNRTTEDYFEPLVRAHGFMPHVPLMGGPDDII
jgi:hypothetical protein